MIRLSFGRKLSKRDVKRAAEVAAAIGGRSVVLIGLMGCGKSAIGRRLANRLSLPFVDADEVIETRAGMTIADIFETYGEAHFRDREAKIIASLLEEGPQVLATGGGAFMNPETRAEIAKKGISIWLKADLPVLMRRVSKRNTRPLLRTSDPEAVMRKLMNDRYPVYAQADLTVVSRDAPHDVILGEIVEALRSRQRLDRRPAV
ncbi:MAG: shikimate kinase [Hyphomicrobiaceae bacterium]|nr:shikimate kinase [Hyphomicrobiaceae bacterium]MCC0009138.1 shikimate kinase [Hyphomicrobiaceae bacterium]